MKIAQIKFIKNTIFSQLISQYISKRPFLQCIVPYHACLEYCTAVKGACFCATQLRYAIESVLSALFNKSFFRIN